MSREGERDLGLLIAIIVGLAGAAMLAGLGRERDALAERLTSGAARPATVSGVHIAAHRDQTATLTVTGLVRFAALDATVRVANLLRSYAAPIFWLALLVAGYPLLARMAGPARDWSRGALTLATLLTGLVGLSLALATPTVWPALAIVASAGLSLANLGASAIFAVLAIAKPASRNRLEHGPAFRPPTTEGPHILIGRSAPQLLPGHIRWIGAQAGPIGIPLSRLSCGVTVIGEKGSGKSRLLFRLHGAIRKAYPNVPILVHDPKGEWYRTYYDPRRDLYFAPHFKGSAAWALWQDFRRAPELCHELLSATIHAHPDPSGTFWMDQAVNLLEASLAGGSFPLSAQYLTRFAREHADDKFALSVFGTARLGFLDLAKVELMGSSTAGDQPAHSIDDFLRWPGRIFLLNDPSCASQQHGPFSLFLTAFLLRALSMPDVPAGTLRAIAIIDEALTFSLPPDVDRRIYALCRSKGICIIAGAQRLPDPRRSERGEWETAEYTFAMKVLNQESQQALSRRAGSVFFKHRTSSESKNESGSSRTESEQDSRLDAVPPEHFGRLSPREFFLFHDRGLITGRTLEAAFPQRNIPMPVYDPREDVRQLSVQLLGG